MYKYLAAEHALIIAHQLFATQIHVMDVLISAELAEEILRIITGKPVTAILIALPIAVEQFNAIGLAAALLRHAAAYQQAPTVMFSAMQTRMANLTARMESFLPKLS